MCELTRQDVEAVDDNVAYKDMIAGQRQDRRTKATEDSNRVQAVSLVDRAGLFVQCKLTSSQQS